MGKNDALRTVSTRRTPQNRPARNDQVANNAGGYVFAIDDMARLRRFLTLGVDGGTYYASAQTLVEDNAEVVFRLAKSNPHALVDEIVAVSTAGRAPRQQPGLFALAVAASEADVDGRRYALSKLGEVARTGTTLFQFCEYAQQFRSWGRSLRHAVSNWYLDKPVDDLAYQVVKYRQRDGWTHRDLLRLAHPATSDDSRKMLFDWICGRFAGPAGSLPSIIEAYEQASDDGFCHDWQGLAGLVAANPGLSWEMLPSDALTHPEVWEALVGNGLPQTALLRQLPRLTNLGLATGETGRKIAAQLQDPARLKKGRVHPMSVLNAMRTYAAGHGFQGRSTWVPERRILDALDAAFYNAYGAVEPTGKRLCLALDVSGSMGAQIGGMAITAREATAAMALVTAATEDDYEIVGFTAAGQAVYNPTTARSFYGGGDGLSKLPISPRQRLDDVTRIMAGLLFGATDCAMPMIWATQQRVPFDAFVIYTDNETWYGDIHPFQALREYRQKMGIDAKLVVVATTSTGFSIANPDDPGMLDVAGFDAAVPNLISDFVRG